MVGAVNTVATNPTLYEITRLFLILPMKKEDEERNKKAEKRGKRQTVHVSEKTEKTKKCSHQTNKQAKLPWVM
jgi:hypothetical protein